MSVTVKRCCNSSILERESKITFNSWIITLDEKDKIRFAAIVNRLFERGFYSPDLPDVDAKILAHIFEIGLVHMSESEDLE